MELRALETLASFFTCKITLVCLPFVVQRRHARWPKTRIDSSSHTIHSFDPESERCHKNAWENPTENVISKHNFNKTTRILMKSKTRSVIWLVFLWLIFSLYDCVHSRTENKKLEWISAWLSPYCKNSTLWLYNALKNQPAYASSYRSAIKRRCVPFISGNCQLLIIFRIL